MPRTIAGSEMVTIEEATAATAYRVSHSLA